MIDTMTTLDDGRTLAFTDIGSPEGPVVLYCYGAPGGRLELVALDTAFAEVGVRVVTPARPGYGGSTPLAGRTTASWATDIVRSLTTSAPSVSVSSGCRRAGRTRWHVLCCCPTECVVRWSPPATPTCCGPMQAPGTSSRSSRSWARRRGRRRRVLRRTVRSRRIAVLRRRDGPRCRRQRMARRSGERHGAVQHDGRSLRSGSHRPRPRHHRAGSPVDLRPRLDRSTGDRRPRR